VSRVALAGLGQVSAAGAGLDCLRQALAGARPEPEWLPAFRGAEGPAVPVLRAKVGHARGLVAPGVARRLDDFSLPALCAALLATQECGVSLPAPERVGIVVATGFGALGSTFAFLSDIVDKGDGLASPIHFAQSVHNAPAFVISSALGITGPSTTVTGFALAWPRALEIAVDWLELGRCDLVLLCSADELHPVAGHALRQLGGWAEDGRMRPLDLDRPSYVPGESFTAMALGRPSEVAPSWGLLEAPRFVHTAKPNGDDAPAATDTARLETWLLGACGHPSEASSYRALARGARGGRSVGAYAALWGGSPTAEAMTVAAAALMLHDGVLRPPPGCEQRSEGIPLLEPGPLAPDAALHCAAVGSDGRAATMAVRRG
jgi:3-oxoacyl-[acyl-carrier-protein] synthase II